MSIQLLNRSLLATVVGAALALGTAGTSFARDRNSAQYDARTAQEEGATDHKGKARARNVIIEFPSYQAALDCFRDKKYQAAKAIRDPVAEADFLIIEGYDGPQPGG